MGRQKATREEFERIYWGNDAHTVPWMTRREFYSDYLNSRYFSVESYSKATTTEADY